jgi:hypothetical protein
MGIVDYPDYPEKWKSHPQPSSKLGMAESVEKVLGILQI